MEILGSDSGYDNRIVVSTDGFKTYRTLGIDNQGLGRRIELEDDGTQAFEFGIVNGHGALLRAGPASNNPDGLEHARVLARDGDSVTLGFEDLVGGGDLDFNDAIIRISTRSSPAPAPTPAPKPQPDPEPVLDSEGPGPGPTPRADDAHTRSVDRSRSGLGDGTNPGQGAGRTRSPNEGTLNPSETEAGPSSKGRVPRSLQALKVHSEQAQVERRRQLIESTYRTEPREGAAGLGRWTETPAAIKRAERPASQPVVGSAGR